MATFVVWIAVFARRILLGTRDSFLFASCDTYALLVSQGAYPIIVGSVLDSAERVDSTEKIARAKSRSPHSFFHVGPLLDASGPNTEAGLTWLMRNSTRRTRARL